MVHGLTAYFISEPEHTLDSGHAWESPDQYYLPPTTKYALMMDFLLLLLFRKQLAFLVFFRSLD